jgi:hypothetical protein
VAPVGGGDDRHVELGVAGRGLHGVAVEGRRVLRERHHDDALRAAGDQRGQHVLREGPEHAVGDPDRHAQALLETRRELPVDGVERRAPADGAVAPLDLGEELGRRRVTAPDVLQELRQLVDGVDGTVRDEQDRGVAHHRAEVRWTKSMTACTVDGSVSGSTP